LIRAPLLTDALVVIDYRYHHNVINS